MAAEPRQAAGQNSPVSTGGAGPGIDGTCSRAAGAMAPVSFGSEEASNGSGAEAGGGTDSPVSTGGAGPGIDETCSRVASAIAPASFGSVVAGTGTRVDAGGGRDAATCGSRSDAKAGTRLGVEAVGAGATAPALGLEEIGIVEMTRGTGSGAPLMSTGCSFSLEPALVTYFLSLLFWTMLLEPMPALRIGGSAGNTYPPNVPR